MTKPITVRDRAGNTVTRENGVLMDGDVYVVTFAMMDAAPGASAQPATLAVAARLFGDSAEFAGLKDQDARNAIVRKRLGAVADGKPAVFFGAAWDTMAKSVGGVAPPAAAGALVLTDAQKAVAQAGIDAALRHAGKAGVNDGAQHPGSRNTGHFTDQQVAASQGHRDAMSVIKSEAWKGADHKAADRVFDGLSYVEIQSIRSGMGAPQNKPHERNVSDAVYHERKCQYDAGKRA